MDKQHLLEALLYYKAEPMHIHDIASALSCSQEEVHNIVSQLAGALQSRGIRLVQKDDTVTLATAPEAAATIEAMRKDELSKDIGKAGLETLTIVLYRGPVARAEIDYIRGVNSTFILRNLMVRGLVERVQNPQDSRSFVYRPTFDLLQYLGVSRIEDLPEYHQTRQELEDFVQQQQEDEEQSQQ